MVADLVDNLIGNADVGEVGACAHFAAERPVDSVDVLSCART